eukprot:895015-Alexandrium_andersonii.AAC.1
MSASLVGSEMCIRDRNYKVLDKLHEQFDFTIEVKLGKQELLKGKKRPSDAEYASYCTAVSTGT